MNSITPTAIFCDFFSIHFMPCRPTKFTHALMKNDQVVTYFVWVLYIYVYEVVNKVRVKHTISERDLTKAIRSNQIKSQKKCVWLAGDKFDFYYYITNLRIKYS